MALLVYADADGVERQITVGAEPVTVGRANECIIRSTDPRMSRNHARFFLDPYGTLHVEDLGSSNGVWIGQQKVQASPVPMNELVVVGSVVFRLMPPPQPASPALQKVEWQQPPTQPSAPPWEQPPQHGAPLGGAPYGYPPPQAPVAAPYQAPPPAHEPAAPPPAYEPPPPPAQLFGAPGQQVNANSDLLEGERKARKAAEEERDAYGERMAQLHGELRTLKSQVDAATAEAAALKAQLAEAASFKSRAAQVPELKAQTAQIPELKAQAAEVPALKAQLAAVQQELAKARIPAAAPDVQQRLEELEDERARLSSDLESERDRANAADAMLRSANEELEVARADMIKAEDRVISEVRAHEERAASELKMRMEELDVARADVTKAEDRVLDLSRTNAELEGKLRDLQSKLSGRLD
jgi:hypothetical protein